mmetsp:Transcript_27975/g.109842  ORF Transcript_27975/g.109842 Transcript_27975/m.109842 type:complete len:80 (+) Transcript_27975:248-487(+)
MVQMQLHKSPQTRNQQRQASETVNIEQSLTLTKNLVRTSISSIAYIRNLFPDDCFTEQHSKSGDLLNPAHLFLELTRSV